MLCTRQQTNQVAHKFAIGSKGMYTYGTHGAGARAGAGAGSRPTQPQQQQQQQQQTAKLSLSTTYPPGNGLLDDMGDNLLELGFLGRGAGSVEVVKALHFPSMRMVAVKKVPIDDQAKLAQAIHELEQLLTNQVRDLLYIIYICDGLSYCVDSRTLSLSLSSLR